jgi:hypothetical protein
VSLLPHFNRDADDAVLAPAGETAPRRGHDRRARAAVAGGGEVGLVGARRRRGRKRARLLSAPEHRILVRWLRRTASRVPARDPFRRRRDVLLSDRVAEARADLLEIAVMLEHVHDPDPASVATLRELLSDGCGSPLYNADVHISELWATLFYVRLRALESRDPDVVGRARLRLTASRTASSDSSPRPLPVRAEQSGHRGTSGRRGSRRRQSASAAGRSRP